MSNYSLKEGAFVLEQFHEASPFAGFLPGLSGLKGIPMWTFYVNRGQAVSGFGIRDKNGPIMEFSPAAIAYKHVSTNGFRTFIKLYGMNRIYEPFQSAVPDSSVHRTMCVRANELIIEEHHKELGLEVRITYFHVPHESFAALARQVELVNRSGCKLQVEVLDGLPEILPSGIENADYKNMGHLLRSWMQAENLDKRIAFYRVSSSTHDEAEVEEVRNGHFYLSFSDDGELIRSIVDPMLVFGENSSFIYPNEYARAPLSELMERPQYPFNKVPCGFSGKAAELSDGQCLKLYALIGHVKNVERINGKAEELTSPAYFNRKRMEANRLPDELTEDIACQTGVSEIDAYSRQCYLDNLLRGGYPYVFGEGKDRKVVHLFSRKHGDLERDYNFFSLLPEYYSQGNGNFRDANQNRRNDVFFNPEVGSFNIRMFFSLIQADGYNPLGVEVSTFEVPADKEEALRSLLAELAGSGREELQAFCQKKFTPGKLVSFVEEHRIELLVDEQSFLHSILALSVQNMEASYMEGYWSDHWTYNMDLVDSYLSIFPDKKEELLFNERTYTFFDSPAYVVPRSGKYVLKGGKVRQYGAVKRDEEKLRRFGRSAGDTGWLRMEYGQGQVYQTDLFAKMLSLGLNKFALLDPYGMGIEMEANKPGWNDAMNGLPGLVGSGMAESFELKRLLTFIHDACGENEARSVSLPEEIMEFLHIVGGLAAMRLNKRLDAFSYWDQVASAREHYRETIRFGISGTEKELSLKSLKGIMKTFLVILNIGIEEAIKLGDGLVPTYFRLDAAHYDVEHDSQGNPLLSESGLARVKVKAFQAAALPYFLEGPSRWLKTIESPEEARQIYKRIKQTDLYDPQLKMYKTSVSLQEETHEIGRIRAFTPGWLERESVFLHMSYKYVLELLKSGLYCEYMEEIRNTLVPFLDPAVYGRSPLENSSFIAPTVNPDPGARGKGFYARLSGSTAEFLSMWIHMMAGKNVFRVENGELVLQLNPILPGWMFDSNSQVSFKFLGTTRVTYLNPRKANTFGEDQASAVSMTIVTKDGSTIARESAILTGELAERARNGEFVSITVLMK
jgi:hypothetical protein